MTQLDYIKDRLITMRKISGLTGYSVPHLLVSYGLARVFHGAIFNEFCSFHMYDIGYRKRSEYLTTCRCRKLLKTTFNKNATQEDITRLSYKSNFNKHYRSFIHRDWLYIPDCTSADIRAFLDRNPKFLLKTSFGTWGNDIHLFESKDLDIDHFLAQYENKPYLLEEFIHQHPAMSELNPSSVNTVRMITAKLDEQVLLVGCGLRVGGGGQFVDNYNHGGVAYPIDLETGIISGPGQNPDGTKKYLLHPSTGYIMPGFKIPHWELLKEEACRAALVSERVGYVGWDIAVTEEGVEFIEGNVRLPGSCVIQLSGTGAYKRLKNFVAASSKN